MPISRQRESGLKRPGSHLRSMREVLGYSIYTTDGEAGIVEDFIIEDTLWGVHHVVVALKQPSPARSFCRRNRSDPSRGRARRPG